MNAVVPASPAPSWNLQRAMDAYARLEASGELHRHTEADVPAFVRDEAGARLAKMTVNDAPATVDAILAWLAPIAAAVAQGPSEADYRARAGAILAACQDVPGWAFSDAIAVAAIRKFQWFPSVAEVRALILDEMADERRQRRALRALATRRGGAAEPPRETQKVREEMAAKLRGVVAEASSRADEVEIAPSMPIKARHLSAGHLAELRAQSPLVQKAREMRALIEAETRRG